MTQQIQDGDRAIHLFMGKEPEIEWVVGKENSSIAYSPKIVAGLSPIRQKEEGERWLKAIEKHSSSGFTVWVMENIPPYHKDWSLLMPVVERIESLHFEVTICSQAEAIDLNDSRHIIIHHDIEISPSAGVPVGRAHTVGNKIEGVYEAVIDFITWYNQNNPIHE